MSWEEARKRCYWVLSNLGSGPFVYLQLDLVFSKIDEALGLFEKEEGEDDDTVIGV